MAYEFSLLSELVCFALREERLLVHMLHSRNQRKASRQSSKSCLFFFDYAHNLECFTLLFTANILRHYTTTNWLSSYKLMCTFLHIHKGKHAVIKCGGNNSNTRHTRETKPNRLFYDRLNYSHNNVMHYSSTVASVLSCQPDVGLPQQSNGCRSSLLDDISSLSR